MIKIILKMQNLFVHSFCQRLLDSLLPPSFVLLFIICYTSWFIYHFISDCFIYSISRLYVPSFITLFILPFYYWFLQLFLLSFIYSYHHLSFITSFVHSLPQSFIHIFINLFIISLIALLTNSTLNSLFPSHFHFISFSHLKSIKQQDVCWWDFMQKQIQIRTRQQLENVSFSKA